MRGLRSNFPEIENHLHEVKPDLMFLSEAEPIYPSAGYLTLGLLTHNSKVCLSKPPWPLTHRLYLGWALM